MATSRPTQLYAVESQRGAHMRGSLVQALRAYTDAVRDQALRPAARAGALVFYREMRAAAPVGDGVLQASIYHWHDSTRSVDGRQVYLVGPNKRKAPHWYNVEYGHWRVNVVFVGEDGKLVATKARLATPVWVPGHPYIRPTWEAWRQEAVRAMRRRLVERLREINSGATAGATEAAA